MSALALLGALGTVLATVQAIPHLVQSLKNRAPSGSTLGWGLYVAGHATWVVYGVSTNNTWLAAPGVLTIPMGIGLAGWGWSYRRHHGDRVIEVRYVRTELAASPPWESDLSSQLSDTPGVPEPRRNLDETLEFPPLLTV